MKKKINKNIPKYKFGAAEISNAVSVGASGIAGMAGISQDSAVGGALKGLGAGLSSIPTPYTQIAGAALSTVGSFWGEAGSVNQQTGEIDYGSGLSKVFGRSKNSLRRESNRIKNSLVDRELTEKLNYDYYNDPNHSANMNVFAAAEGAIVDNTQKVLVSPDELIYDYKNKTLTKVPFGNGKPNTDDNVFMEVKGGEKKAVINNKKEMETTVDGKTLAKRFAPMIDKPGKKFSQGTIDARDAIIRKALKIQEANKTKPQEYAMYNEGTGEAGIKKLVEKSRKRGAIVAQTEVDGKTYVKLGDGNWYDTFNGKVGKRTIKTPKLRKAFEQYDTEFQQNAAKNVTKTKDVTIPNGGYTQNWESDVLKTPLAQSLFGQNKKYNLFTPQEAVERTGYNYGPTFANYNADLDIPGFQNVTNILNNYSNFAPKKGGGYTRSNASSVQQSTTTDTPVVKPKTLTAPVYTPAKTDITMGRNKLPEMSKQLPKVDIKQSTGENKKSNINWLDYLNLMGPLANIFSSKPEKVNVYAPRREYGPTYYNERPIIEQIGLNRAITNYNAAKKTPNTGAGMRFALQSQMNTNKAIGTALANKENIQNQYAFQNANIYNQWSDVYANAKHIAAVEQAQNDAAARNIKNKGVGDLFTNAGKNVRNRYLTKRDEGLYQAMLPDLEYGMTSEQLKKLTELYA